MTTTTIQLFRELLLLSVPIVTTVAERIFVNTIPQGAETPCVVLNSVWDEPEYHVSGSSGARTARVRVTCIGKSASTVDLLSEFVGEALRDVAHRPVMVDTTILSESVTIMQLGTRISDVGDDRLFHRVILEFKMRWLQ